MKLRAVLFLWLAWNVPAVADDALETEQRLSEWLTDLAQRPRDPLLQAQVEALTHYESKALGPAPDPHPASRAQWPLFDIGSLARATLRAWDRIDANGLPMGARAPNRSKAAAKAGGAVMRYVESAPAFECGADEICIAIGVPVPAPIDSPTPVAGFRSYASLIAGLEALAGQNTGIAASQSVGRTAANRDIRAFELGDADALTSEGLPEPSFLQTGGIHAREWIAPEAVAAFMERALAQRGDGALYQYLIENVHSVLVPVLNVDGFLQTQRWPDRARQSDCPEDGSLTPRDGRMRRKNMNADGVLVDEDLLTPADATLGVDANRNNLPWWSGTPGSSGTPCSLVYRGIAAASEREVAALQAAASIARADRLRLYIDTHSYERDYLSADTSNARRNALQQQLAQRMSAANGQSPRPYGYAASPPGSGIGSTDEYFANTYQIPAYTLEIEPTSAGLDDYPGGINVSNSGFILPASEVDRVRNEITNATTLGVYRQAGPPSVTAIELRDAANALVFAGRWQVTSATARHFQITTPAALQPGATYSLWIAFNKPMRVRDASGAVVQYRGQNVPLAPTLALEGVAQDGHNFNVTIAATAQGWRDSAGGPPNGFARYRDDAFSASFSVPSATPLAGAKRLSLAIDARDLSGQPLDANPATAVDWQNGAWTRYEDAVCVQGDAGGVDRSARLIDDGSALCTAVSADNGGGGAIDPWWLLLLALAAARLRARTEEELQ